MIAIIILLSAKYWYIFFQKYHKTYHYVVGEVWLKISLMICFMTFMIFSWYFPWKLSPGFHDTGLETEARFPAKPFCGNRSPIWAAHGESRASDLLLTSLGPYQLRQIRVASPPIQEHLLHSHRLLPQPGHLKSKIQTPVWILSFGFRSLDFGSWILDCGFWILDFGVWILDLGSWIVGFGFWILDLGFWISDLGFWVLDFGSWILDFGFWIVVVSVLSVAAPNATVWILDLGFWISDFWFWISDFGILDFGFWNFGFRILDFAPRFGFCIRLLLLHAGSGRRIRKSSELAIFHVKVSIIALHLAFLTTRFQAGRKASWRQCWTSRWLGRSSTAGSHFHQFSRTIWRVVFAVKCWNPGSVVTLPWPV